MTNRKSPWTRREFVQTSATTALAATMPLSFARREDIKRLRPSEAVLRAERMAVYPDADHVRAMALRAIEVAKAAGASYADAKLTRTVSESFMGAGLFLDFEDLAIGVRALVNGAWGFAASPYWELDEAEQLAKDAVEQATINARISAQHVDMGRYPVASGSWSTPIRIDPFKISLEEKTDFVVSFSGLFPRHVSGRDISGGMPSMDFKRQEQSIATSDGAYFTQTLYMADGQFVVSVRNTDPGASVHVQSVTGQGVDAAGAGWELMLDARLREQIPGLIAEAEELLLAPRKPVQVGRYDLVCDAGTMGAFVSGTLGEATELDRALGDEADAGGTSYLGPNPFKYLGTSLGEALLNVQADRSTPRGLATVKWDDEGVLPDTFTVIDKGTLVDYQTTREQAAWLKAWYTKRQRPIQSHGCASSSSALAITQQATPNLSLAPGKEKVGFNDLVAGTKRGLALTGGSASMDFQSRSGSSSGLVREITNGKLGAVVIGAGFLFDSTELWKKLIALGGVESQRLVPCSEVKGQPAQSSSYSVTAVPGTFKNMATIDVRRKA